MSDERPIGQNLAKKIRSIQQEAANIPKNGYNDFHKYNYVLASDAVDAIRRLCVEQSLVFAAIGVIETKQVGTITRERSADSLVWEVVIRYLITDPDSGESIVFDWRGHGADPMDKGIYKAMTGCLKYALMQFFMVAGEDSDPETVTDRERREAKKAAGKQGSPGKGSSGQAPAAAPADGSSKPAAAGRPGPVASADKITYIQDLLKSEWVPGPVRGKADAWLTANKGKWSDVAAGKMVAKLMLFAVKGARRGAGPTSDKQIGLIESLIKSSAVPKNIAEKIQDKLNNHRSDAEFTLTSGEASAMIECCQWFINDKTAAEKAQGKDAAAEKDEVNEFDAIQDKLMELDAELARRQAPSDNHAKAFREWRDTSSWQLEDCDVWMNTIKTWPVKQ